MPALDAPQLSAPAGLPQADPGVALLPKDGFPCWRGDDALAPLWPHDCCGWFQASWAGADDPCVPQGLADCCVAQGLAAGCCACCAPQGLAAGCCACCAPQGLAAGCCACCAPQGLAAGC